MIIETNNNPGAKELLNLFSQTTWAKDRSEESIKQMLKSNDLKVCLRDSNKLIGFGRIITDGCYRGLLDDIIIDTSYRGKGYSTLLMNELLKLASNIDVIFLNASPTLFDYYSKYGFEKYTGLTMIKK
jgi:predicted GNAT family N-acyltransferase